jgi:hypothetical protein
MNNNATNKKKLELKKTAIANLTLSESQMKMLVGGDKENLLSGDQICQGLSDLHHGCTSYNDCKIKTKTV